MRESKFLVCYILVVMFAFTNVQSQDFTLTVQSHHDVDDQTEVQIGIVASGIPDGEFLGGYAGTVAWDNRYLTFVSAQAEQGVGDFSLGQNVVDQGNNTSARSFQGSAEGDDVTNGTIMIWTFTYDSEDTGECAFVRIDGSEMPVAWVIQDGWGAEWTAELIDGEVCGFGCDDPVEPTLSSNSPICEGNTAIYTITGTPGIDVYYSGVAGQPASPVTIGSEGSVDVNVDMASENLTLTIYQVSDGECSINPTGLEETIVVQYPPDTPLANSASNPTDDSFVANWDNVVSATEYLLDVSTDNEFNSFIDGFNNLNVGNVNQYLVEGLSSSTEYFYRVRAQNNCGTGDYSETINVTTDQGVGFFIEQESNTNLRVFPNPTTDILYVEVFLTKIQETQVLITDVTGRKVMNLRSKSLYPGKNTLEIPVSDLKKGIYSIQLVEITNASKNFKKLNFIIN